jgi:hypothetical protein
MRCGEAQTVKLGEASRGDGVESIPLLSVLLINIFIVETSIQQDNRWKVF